MTGTLRPPTDEEWRAITTRDRHSDGRFIWVALTTNIYCRPSCGARRPSRHNMAVLGTAADAERRGYSACRRCDPATPFPSDAESSVASALAYIQAHPDQPIALRNLANRSGLSRSHLQQVFTRVVGLSPGDYCDYRRLIRLKELLRSGASVADAAYGAGYGSIRAVYERAARSLGMTPATYRRGGAGETVRYAVFDASLGHALIAFTRRGLCSVLLGQSDDALARDLAREVPQATVSRERVPPVSWTLAVQHSRREEPLLLTMPLALRRDVCRARITMSFRVGEITEMGG